MRALNGEHVRNREVVVKSGPQAHRLMVAARPLKNSSGNLIGAVATCQDITGQWEALEAQRKLAQEFNALLRQLQLQIERMPLGYVLFDADLRISDWNPAAEKIFGFGKEEIQGLGPPFDKIVPQEHREPIHLLLTDVVMSGIGGRVLAERLHDLRPEVKVLYPSGYTNDSVVRHGVSQEQINYLQKPYSPAGLAHKVREGLTLGV